MEILMIICSLEIFLYSSNVRVKEKKKKNA